MIKVVIFFGVPGSGKSFIAKNLAENYNAYFYEADDDYTMEMREKSKESKEIAIDVTESFYNLVVTKINKLLESNSLIFVATALGNNNNRIKFINEFGNRVFFVLIKPDSTKHLPAVVKRELKDSNISKEELTEKLKIHLAKKLYNFEEPTFKHLVINNSYDFQSISQAKSELDRILK